MKYCTACNTKYEDSVSFCALDGEVLEADPASIVHTVLDGQYQMEALLGKGGMGAVYRARHILLGDRVAIKVLPLRSGTTRNGCEDSGAKGKRPAAFVTRMRSRFTIFALLPTARSTW